MKVDSDGKPGRHRKFVCDNDDDAIVWAKQSVDEAPRSFGAALASSLASNPDPVPNPNRHARSSSRSQSGPTWSWVTDPARQPPPAETAFGPFASIINATQRLWTVIGRFQSFAASDAAPA